jgi:hypothetical protein
MRALWRLSATLSATSGSPNTPESYASSFFRRSSIPILLPTQEVAQAAQASFNESNPFNDSKAITCIIHNARVAAFHIRKSEIALAADYHLKAADVVHAELNKIVKSTGRTVSRSRIDCSLHVHQHRAGGVARCGEAQSSCR